jgi:hypothetical protein
MAIVLQLISHGDCKQVAENKHEDIIVVPEGRIQGTLVDKRIFPQRLYSFGNIIILWAIEGSLTSMTSEGA